jgi:hypothetical protein
VKSAMDLYHENADESKDAIMYGSKCWDTVMLSRPTFYKEGYALFWALDKCRYYIDASPFETTVRTDHMPLKWIKHSTRGLLTPFMLEKCAGMTYTIEHVPGVRNLVGDAMSREPFFSRPEVTTGMEALVEVLLKKLNDKVKTSRNMWVWAEKDTQNIARAVQAWRKTAGSSPNQLAITSPKQTEVQQGEWEFAIIAPSGERATLVCASLFRTAAVPKNTEVDAEHSTTVNNEKSFACLVPSDLVSWIALDEKLHRNEDIQRMVDKSAKFVSLDNGLTWIVHGIHAEQSHVVFATEGGKIVEAASEETEKSIFDQDEWVREQKTVEEKLRNEAEGEVITMVNGLLAEVKPGETVKIIVPPSKRVPLIKRAHETSKHMGWKKVLELMRKTYTWAGMSSLAKKTVTACAKCADMKGRRNLAHGQFSSVIHDGPRQAYAFDFYGVAQSDAGYKNILTVIDLFSREVLFIPTYSRNAEEVVRCLLQRLINVKGVPQMFMTDEAPEFVGKLVEGLCSALKIKHLTTMGYDARRNAICERVHEFLGQCLVMLPEEERCRWENHLTEFSFAHDTATHEHLGQKFTPFEIGHGAEAKTMVSAPVADSSVQMDEEKMQGYFGRVKLAAQTFCELARNNLVTAHEEQNKRLNQGSRKESFEVGDLVAIYFPTHTVGSEWRVKHTKKWRGPMRVTEKLSNTSYRMQDIDTSQIFNRSVTNIKRYKAEVNVAVEQLGKREEDAKDSQEAAGIRPGDMVATRDSEETCEFWLGEVISVDADYIKCHYWATRGSAMKKAVFKPAYIGQRTGKTILTYNTAKAGEECERWTGQVPRELIITKVKLGDKRKGARKLKPLSQKALCGWVMAKM